MLLKRLNSENMHDEVREPREEPLYLPIVEKYLLPYLLKKREIYKLNDKGVKAHGVSFVNLKYGMTHYELSPPSDKGLVILIGGASIPMWVWDAQYAFLVHEGYQVLRYDLYGKGLSAKPKKRYRHRLFYLQLKELIEALNISGKFSIIGHSVGSAIATNYALMHPSEIEKIALIGPVVNHKKVRFEITLSRIPIINRLVMNHVVMEKVIKRAYSAFATETEMFEEYKRRFDNQVSVKGYEKCLLSLINGDLMGNQLPRYRRLGRMNIPTLVVWGNKDVELPRELLNEMLASMPQVDFLELEKVGHSANFPAKKSINEKLKSFLST